MPEQFEEKILDKKCKVRQSSSILEIEIDKSESFSFIPFFLCFPLIVLSFIGMIVSFPPEDFIYIMFFVTMALTFLFFLDVCIKFYSKYYNNTHRTDLIICDKTKKLLIFTKKTPKYKEFREYRSIELKEIDKINYYYESNRTGGIAKNYLVLILVNGKKLKILSNRYSYVKLVGEHLAKFLDIILINKESQLKDKLFCFFFCGFLVFIAFLFPFLLGDPTLWYIGILCVGLSILFTFILIYILKKTSNANAKLTFNLK